MKPLLSLGRFLGLNKFKTLRTLTDKLKLALTETRIPMRLKVAGVPVAYMRIMEYRSGDYEPETTALIKRIVKEDWNIVDIGAQVGFFSVLASSLVPKGNVYTFEPSPRWFKKLLNNTKRYANIHVANVGVDSASGEIEFHVQSDGFYETHGDVETTKVKVVALDDYLKGIRIDLIKMDIEGAEARALRGMKTVLKENNPYIIMEVAPKVTDKVGLEAQDPLDYLASLGFKLFWINNDGSLTEKNIEGIVQEARAQKYANICCHK